jgi:large subunit ribosomal protein L10
LATSNPNKKGTPVKQKKVSDLTDKLNRANMAVVTDYRGMKMPEISDLRGQLRKVDTEYHVAKNTLVRIAGTESGKNTLDSMLSGTTAIAFCFGDIQAPAKLLTDFANTSKFLKIRVALLQGQLLQPQQLTAVANLPALPVLKAQFLGALQGPSANVVGTLNGPLQGFLGVLQARADKIAAG